MANVLHKPTTNFTQISNTALNDKELSLKGKGMLAFMLSKPDDWTFSTGGLRSQLLEGDTAIRKALNDLRDLGYLTIESIRDELGRIDHWSYTIRHEPEGRDPDVENPQLETKHTSNTRESKKDNSNYNTVSSGKYKAFSKRLKEVCEQVITIPRNTNLGSWSKAFRKLHEVDGVPLGEIEQTLNDYADIIGKPYIPEAYSGKSFRAKYTNIKAAIKRTKKDNPEPSREGLDIVYVEEDQDDPTEVNF